MNDNNFYKISEVADILGVHEDTIRKWEEDGLVVPERIGRRRDRRYTGEHIKQIKEQGLVSDLMRRSPDSIQKNYSEYTKDQLIKELQLLKKQKQYGLVWEDKKEEVVERCKKEASILEVDPEMNVQCAKGEQKHIMIEGDNYHALQVLNYTHKGKIDVIYIDPPYNTGARDWKYNNDYVDSSDQFRHSKWLSLMNNRLRLLHGLLSNEGFFVIAIDGHELFTLGILLDEIFGESNRVGLVTVVHNPKGRNLTKWFSANSEYMLVYAKDKLMAQFNNVVLNDETREQFDLTDDNGRYRLDSFMRARTEALRINKPSFWYPLYVSPDLNRISLDKKDGDHEVYPISNAGKEVTWITLPSTFERENQQDVFVAKKEQGNIRIYRKYYEQQVLKNFWDDQKYQSEFHGTNLLKRIMGDEQFSYPKSLYLIIDILKIVTQKDSTILDFFAGSGTTGHAVMELNKEDGGNRQFILCTNNENNNGDKDDPSKGIARGVCQPRIKKVMEGYKKNGNGDWVEGLGGSLEYFKTDFVDVENIDRVNDDKKLELTHRAGSLIALKENAFQEVEKNEWYQIFTNEKNDKMVGIYFKENIEKLQEMEDKVIQDDKEIKLYLFSHGAENDWESDYEDYDNVTVEDIPGPLLKIYRELNG